MIRAVPIDLIDECWPIVAPMLEPALRYHPHIDIDDLHTIAIAGRADLFVLITDQIQCAYMLEVDRYPKHCVANMLALGGRFGTLVHIKNQVIPHWREWACANGCDRIGMSGRPGWAKLILSIGEDPVHLVSAWSPA